MKETATPMPANKPIAQAALESYDENIPTLQPSEIADMVRPGLMADSSIILRTDGHYIFAWLQAGQWITHSRTTRLPSWEQPMFGWPTAHTILNRALCRLQSEIADDLRDQGLAEDAEDDPDQPLVPPLQAATLFPGLLSSAHGAMVHNSNHDQQLQQLDEAESQAADDLEELFKPGTPMGDTLRRLTAEALLTASQARTS